VYNTGFYNIARCFYFE